MTEREFLDKRYVGGFRTLVHEGIENHPMIVDIMGGIDDGRINPIITRMDDYFKVNLDGITYFEKEYLNLDDIKKEYVHKYLSGYNSMFDGFVIKDTELWLESREFESFLDKIIQNKKLGINPTKEEEKLIHQKHRTIDEESIRNINNEWNSIVRIKKIESIL